MSDRSLQEFTGLRKFVWPIHFFELKKVLPMFLMMFFISFVYTVLRDLKDTIIINAPGSDAETIPSIKLLGVLPAAMIFLAIYSKLANVLSRERLFYTTLTPFLIFFTLFTFVIYPNVSMLHPHQSADWLASVLPRGFNGAISIYRNWSFALFFIFSELWGSVALALLFWGFANQITRVSEAKRFYLVFGLGANVALPFAGQFVRYFSNPANLVGIEDQWGYTLSRLTLLVVTSGIIVMSLFHYMTHVVMKDPRFAPKKGEIKVKKKKPKMTFMQSLKELFSSRYILALTILVIAYGSVINIYEVQWKSQIKHAFSNNNECANFMGFCTQIRGFVSILMMLFVGGNVIRNFGWLVGAAFTPIMLVVTGTLFFAFTIFRENLAGTIAFLGTTPLMMAIYIGFIQNVLSKSAKYSLFDPTKEIAFIPLDEETKVKGKAAVDVVGARMGKSLGSGIQVILAFFAPLSQMMPLLALVAFCLGAVWLYAVGILNRDFLALSEQRRLEREEAAPEETLAAQKA